MEYSPITETKQTDKGQKILLKGYVKTTERTVLLGSPIIFDNYGDLMKYLDYIRERDIEREDEE